MKYATDSLFFLHISWIIGVDDRCPNYKEIKWVKYGKCYNMTTKKW
jgi:hypothetical protein